MKTLTEQFNRFTEASYQEVVGSLFVSARSLLSLIFLSLF